MASALVELKKHSVVVADTGDFEKLKEFSPDDATTNPTLLLRASQLPEYQHLLDDAVAFAKKTSKSGEEQLTLACDKLAVNFGVEILKHIPGVVSTEVDANLSFESELSKAKARRLIAMYEDVGVKRDRILIKMATTWESCRAAQELEQEGIHCNMTLLFNLTQAIAAAEANATLISPFVGRILDWHKKANPDLQIDPAVGDPGVQSVKQVYDYYKQHSYPTVVMAASFRNSTEIIQLAGCDKLTISPALLTELSKSTQAVPLRLIGGEAGNTTRPPPLTEAQFRWGMNEDPMATELLAGGIRNFNSDLIKLRQLVAAKL